MIILTHLNPQQLHAATHSCSCLVIAGPGTGKTATLTARIQYLLSDKAVSPNQILALTFTKKAAREMQQRVTSSLSEQKDLPFIDTLHAWCYWFLQNYHPDWQINPKTIISESEQKQIFKNLKNKPDKLDDLIHRISEWKQSTALSFPRRTSTVSLSTVSSDRIGSVEPPESIGHATTDSGDLTPTAGVNPTMDPRVHRVRLDSENDILDAYQKHLRDHNLLDFDDLLIDSLILLQNPDTTKPNYQHILIDEFQDFTNLQFQIIQKLIFAKTQVFIVGDPYQSIYGFRGAASNLVNQLTNSNFKQINLTQNYRSHQLLLDASGSLFDPPRSLQSLESTGPLIQLLQTSDEKTESFWISKTIQQLTGSVDHNIDGATDIDSNNLHFSDIAILYRSHSLSTSLQHQLAKDSLPHQVIGEKTLLEYSDVATAIDKLQNLNFKTLDSDIYNLSSLLTHIYQYHHLDQTQPAIQRLQLLKTISYQYSHDLNSEIISQFLENLKFYQPADTFQTGADKITISTIHAAKGLEFHTVFIIGVEEGLIPFHKSLDNLEQLEEEKRLFYVALTRAKHRVFLTTTKHRYIHGKSEVAQPSRFLRLISDQHLQITKDELAVKYADQREKLRQKKRQLSFL